MRDFEQRKEEIFARGKEKIARRKKITKRVVMTCVPVCLCVCIAGGWLALGGFGMSDKAAPEVITQQTGMSKNQFKRAVGHLLKEGYIEIGEKSIRRLK